MKFLFLKGNQLIKIFKNALGLELHPREWNYIKETGTLLKGMALY